MFESLSERLGGVFERLTRQGALSADDVRTALREVRVALLEADVSLPVVRDFIKRVEAKATGAAVTKSVTPKFGLLAPARAGGTIATRYFMPWNCHPTLAVTGSQCLASCVLTPGTVAEGLFTTPEGQPALVLLEHPAGVMDVTVDYDNGPDGFHLRSAGVLRTARLLARGEVFVPGAVWAGH